MSETVQTSFLPLEKMSIVLSVNAKSDIAGTPHQLLVKLDAKELGKMELIIKQIYIATVLLALNGLS